MQPEKADTIHLYIYVYIYTHIYIYEDKKHHSEETSQPYSEFRALSATAFVSDVSGLSGRKVIRVFESFGFKLCGHCKIAHPLHDSIRSLSRGLNNCLLCYFGGSLLEL